MTRHHATVQIGASRQSGDSQVDVVYVDTLPLCHDSIDGSGVTHGMTPLWDDPERPRGWDQDCWNHS
jgi:hypothetical protein